MRGEELGVEQGEAAPDQALHQMHQRHLGRIARPGEHALAEKRPAQLHAVKPAHQRAVLPAFYRMGVAGGMQRAIQPQNFVIDPALLPPWRGRGAGFHHCGKADIAGDGEMA